MKTVLIILAIAIFICIAYFATKKVKYPKTGGPGGSEPSGEKDNPNDQTKPRK